MLFMGVKSYWCGRRLARLVFTYPAGVCICWLNVFSACVLYKFPDEFFFCVVCNGLNYYGK